MNLAFISTYQ